MRITGRSMMPTLEHGELVVVDQRAYDSRAPRRDEVVAARPRAFGGKTSVKRVAGLPHESVEVDGRRWQLGEDQFFLLGDYQEDSADSRRFGPVTRAELLGPVRRLRLFRKPFFFPVQRILSWRVPTQPASADPNSTNAEGSGTTGLLGASGGGSRGS